VGARLAKLLRVDRTLRLKTMPIILAPPLGLVIGPFTPFIPLPSKVTIQYLPPIDLRETYGEDPDLEEVYADILARMQDVLTSLQRERRLPVIG
jgi:hypothetical protein